MSTQYLNTSVGRLEFAWHGPQPKEAPTLVFLHEGLGCLSLWRDIPEQLAAQTGCGALVYSRLGHGKSEVARLPCSPRFMHAEALVLEEVLRLTGVRQALLLGHSDGASIALIHAGSASTIKPRGMVLLAPHVFVEPCTLASIAQLAEAFRATDLPKRLAKHHGDNTAAMFGGWSEIWLHPDFRAWNIEAYLPQVDSPILLIQGEQDEYGTWQQIEAIQRQARGHVATLRLTDCGHAPHRDRPELVLPVIMEFVRRVSKGSRNG